MSLIKLIDITKTYGTTTILDDITMQINAGEKLGIIGANGSGKTTLLKMILGEETPSSGTVKTYNAVLGYLPQQQEYDASLTVHDYLVAASATTNDAYETEEYLIPLRIEQLATSFGFIEKLDRTIGTLSGGEQNLVGLAAVLMKEPDVLLLDEPGNHLDYTEHAWLESFLQSYKGTVVIVSHNRYLLDRVCTSIIEIENKTITRYAGNYSHYRLEKIRSQINQREEYAANQKRLAQLESLVKRFAEIARRVSDPAWGKRLHARQSQLEREKNNAVEKPVDMRSALKFKLNDESKKANIAVQINHYTKTFENNGEVNCIYNDASAMIACGEKIALVGKNGSGKTTLIRDIVCNGAWDNDTLRVGPSMRIGYMSQDQKTLTDTLTVTEQLAKSTVLKRGEMFSAAKRFLFSPNDLDKKIASLSGGEKNRLQLMLLFHSDANFLILDEPTNHLDIATREAVEDALTDFNGTVLLVSHDRYLLDKIVDRVIEIQDGTLVAHTGNFSDFMADTYVPPSFSGSINRKSKEKKKSISVVAQKNNTNDIEIKIETLEKEKQLLERQSIEAMSKGNQSEAKSIANKLAKTNQMLNNLYEEWMKHEE